MSPLLAYLFDRWWFWTILGVVAVGGVTYWFLRPPHWSDGEGMGRPDNPFDDTDVGSFRWFFMRGTREGQMFGGFLNLRDWWQNERDRWRKP